MRCVPCKRASFLLHCRLASSGQCPFSGAPRQTIYCQKVHLYTGWFFNWPQILGVFWALTSTFMPVTVSQCRDATGRCVIVYHLSLPRERRAEEDSGNMLLMHHYITAMVRLQCCQIARSKLGICLLSPPLSSRSCIYLMTMSVRQEIYLMTLVARCRRILQQLPGREDAKKTAAPANFTLDN